MTDKDGNAGAESEESANSSALTARSTGAAARLRLVRRIVDALDPLEGASILADVENRPIAPDATKQPTLRTDLLITALDLRIRIASLPGRDHQILETEEIRRAAWDLLLDYPETASVIVVVDDPTMSARVMEPFDASGAIVPEDDSERSWEFPGPVGDVVRKYLRQVNPGWQQVDEVLSSPSDFGIESESLAREALTSLQGARKNVTEWRAARASLGEVDIDWVASIAAKVRAGEETNEPVKWLRAHLQKARRG